MRTTTTDQTTTTTSQDLLMQLNVEESDHNAVLWYKYEGREAGKLMPNIMFLRVRTKPEMQSCCEQSPQLLTWVQEHQERQATQAVLYSAKGFMERVQIMLESPRQVESKSSDGCCLGNAVERAAQNKMNELYYCQELQKRHPTTSQVTSFTLATTTKPPVKSKKVRINAARVFPSEPTPVEVEIISRE